MNDCLLSFLALKMNTQNSTRFSNALVQAYTSCSMEDRLSATPPIEIYSAVFSRVEYLYTYSKRFSKRKDPKRIYF